MPHRPPRDVQITPPDPKRRRSVLHASSPSGIWTSWTVVGVKLWAAASSPELPPRSSTRTESSQPCARLLAGIGYLRVLI
ncbi:hypothetical protein KP509_1Z130100 [Ceratopteris richardii]|nr:hypothetical protein KP509_1Z130100 [Ceratopteris richardii]